jgi:hypothetical protein
VLPKAVTTFSGETITTGACPGNGERSHYLEKNSFFAAPASKPSRPTRATAAPMVTSFCCALEVHRLQGYPQGYP